MSANKVAQDFIKAINTQKQKPSAYDTKGEVMRITEGIAWVHLAGGIDETPCELTIGANVGDTVQVRVAGGRAWLVGNSTEPPVGDKHVQNIVKKEKKNIVKEVDEEVTQIVREVQKIEVGNNEITPEKRKKIWMRKADFAQNGYITSKVYCADDKYSMINNSKYYVYYAKIELSGTISDIAVAVKYSDGGSVDLSVAKYYNSYDIVSAVSPHKDDGTLWSTAAKCQADIDTYGKPLVPSAYSSWGCWGPVGRNYGIIWGNILGVGYYPNKGNYSQAKVVVYKDRDNKKFVKICVKKGVLSADWQGIIFSYEGA